MVRIRILGLAAARIAAVALALVTLFVFVVQAQRRAERKRVGAQPVAVEPVAAEPGAPPDAPALGRNAGDPTVAAPIDSAVRLEELRTFLPTSKSLQLSPSELVPGSTAEGDPYESFGNDPISPVFLPSSKVLTVSDGVRRILTPGCTLHHEVVKPAPKP